MTDRACDCIEIVSRESLRDVRVVLRLGFDSRSDAISKAFYHAFVTAITCGIRLATNVILDPRGGGVGVGDPLIMFVRYALRNCRVDPHLGPGRHNAEALRQARVERFCS